MRTRTIVNYILSVVAIWAFIGHLIEGAFIEASYWAWTAPWIVAYAAAIASIYGGIIIRGTSNDAREKAYANSAAAMGSLVLLGATLSAIFLVPSLR